MKLLSIFAIIAASVSGLCLKADANEPGKPLYLADPFIFEENGVFYAYGTYAKDGIAVYKSYNMKEWEGPCGNAVGGLALHKSDSWGEYNFWAPEVYKSGDRYVMTYSAEERVVVAFSDSPAGPFRQETPYAPYATGKGSIDSHIFMDDDGQAYMYFVRFGFGKGNEIRYVKLEKDLKTVCGPQKECINATRGTWEVVEPEHRVSEGPFVLKHKGLYYLSYSCNHFRSCDYAVGYAVSNSPSGPWKRYEGNPILIRQGGHCGTGHHAFFKRSDGKLFIIYHAHKNLSEVAPRKMLISPCKFKKSKNGPDRIVVSKKTISATIR